MTRFVVDLGNFKLSSAQKDAISADIQGAVLAHLGKTGGNDAALSKFAGLIPPGWRGLILREHIAELEAANKQVGAFAQQSAPGVG
jgi:hypothetical protein